MCSRWNATSEYTNNEAKTSLLCRKVIVFTFLALVEKADFMLIVIRFHKKVITSS